MPYRAHSRSRSIGYVVLAAAGVAGLLVLIYLVGTHRGGDDSGYEPPAAGRHDSAGDPAERQRDERHRDRPTKAPAGSGGPDWFAGLAVGPGVSPGPHQAVISVASADGEAIGVKYAFRTGDGVRSGLMTTGSSWSASDTVRGGEPLAGVIAQVASGSISCTVRIDGRVVSHKTGSGQYATVSCAG